MTPWKAVQSAVVLPLAAAASVSLGLSAIPIAKFYYSSDVNLAEEVALLEAMLAKLPDDASVVVMTRQGSEEPALTVLPREDGDELRALIQLGESLPAGDLAQAMNASARFDTEVSKAKSETVRSLATKYAGLTTRFINYIVVSDGPHIRDQLGERRETNEAKNQRTMLTLILGIVGFIAALAVCARRPGLQRAAYAGVQGTTPARITTGVVVATLALASLWWLPILGPDVLKGAWQPPNWWVGIALGGALALLVGAVRVLATSGNQR